MKKLIRKSAVLVVLFAALQSYATEIPVLGGLNENETAMLTFLNVKQGNKLWIKDAEGSVLYKEKIRNVEEFINRFNLSFLPDGEYFIEVDKESEIVTIPVEIAENNVIYDVKSSYVKSSRKTRKANQKEKPIELEKGVQRRGSTFKGMNFVEYYNLNK